MSAMFTVWRRRVWSPDCVFIESLTAVTSPRVSGFCQPRVSSWLSVHTRALIISCWLRADKNHTVPVCTMTDTTTKTSAMYAYTLVWHADVFPQLLFPTIHRCRLFVGASVWLVTQLYILSAFLIVAHLAYLLSFAACRQLLSCALNRPAYWCE